MLVPSIRHELLLRGNQGHACRIVRTAQREGRRTRTQPQCDRPRGGLFDQEPCFLRDDGLERAAARVRDDRPAARLRFERHDAEIFLAGKHHDSRAAIQLTHFFFAASSEKLDGRAWVLPFSMVARAASALFLCAGAGAEVFVI